MKIGISSSFINKILPMQTIQHKGLSNNALMSDVFQKSTISFSGLTTEKKSDIPYQQMVVSEYINALSPSSIQKSLFSRRNERIEVFNHNLIQASGNIVSANVLNKCFKDANINTVLALCNFLKTFTKNPDTKEIFKDQEYEAIQIYGKLAQKDNLAKFPEILLYIYNQEFDSEEPDFDKLNTTVEFLNNTGIKDFSEFEKKFAHLSNNFNGFTTISDKADAIEYLRQTYDAKLGLIESSLNTDSNIPAAKSKDIYANLFDVIDYLYIENNGNSLEPLDSFIDIAAQNNKLKSNSLSAVSDYFNGFEKPEDKIDFYMFLKESDVSIPDFNVLTHKSIISDNDVMSNICNMSAICQEISDIDGSDIQKAKEKYRRCPNLFNSFYDVKSDNTDRIKSLLNIINKFNIKDENSMLAFYNKISSTKQQHITSSDFNYLVDLLQFDNSNTDNIFERAKQQKITPLELLLNAEEEFEKVEPEIEEILVFDETGCFAGKSPLDVYNAYKKIADEHNQNIVDVIAKAVKYNMSDSAVYKAKLERITKFSNYFEDKESLINFVTKNGIKLDGSDSDNEFCRNCRQIFDLLEDKSNPEEARKNISYYSESGFLKKSRKSLPVFLKYLEKEPHKKEILKTLANKKVPSLGALNMFYKKYRSKNGGYENIINHLMNVPDNVSFQEYIETLQYIQSKFDRLNLQININNDNISRIDASKFPQFRQLSNEALCTMLNQVFDAKETNFISKLPQALTNEKTQFTRFRIAKEIADKILLTDESYSNLEKVLKLDKKSLKLRNDCPDYLYVKAIERQIPDKFVDFINSNTWLRFDNKCPKVPNLPLHARLRAIDRFALDSESTIDTLYSKETIQKLRKLFKAAYCQTPSLVRSTDESQRLITNFTFENSTIECVFTQQGKMITIVPKKTY